MSYMRPDRSLALAAFGFSLALAAAASADAPRYRLTVGDAHTFEGDVQFKVRGRTIDRRETYAAWVVAANADGTTRVVLRREVRQKQPDGSLGKATADLGYADLPPDGRVARGASHGLSLASLFPVLPPDETTVTWDGPGRTPDGVTTYTRAADAPHAFTSTATGPLYAMQLTTYDATYTFDPATGLLARLENRYVQGFGSPVEATGAIAHAGTTTLPPDELARLAAESAEAFATLRRFDSLVATASHQPPTEATETLAEAQQAIRELTSSVAHPAVKAYAEAFAAGAPGKTGLAIEIAKARAAMIGRPAPAWELPDLDGNLHRLSDHAGKVVVLEFWHRGCTICMATMPQFRALVERYAGQPVAFVGMNTDANVDDAKFVVAQMKLTHPNVRAGPVREAYQLKFYPSLFVLDKAGIVREVHVGRAEDLAAEVARAVEHAMRF